MAVLSPESWSTYGLHWLLIKKRISAGLSLYFFFFHLQKFKRICWAIAPLTCTLWKSYLNPYSCLILGWRFRLFFKVRISKEKLNLFQLGALINCPDFFVHWTAGTKTSIHIFVYQLVEWALGTEGGSLGLGECNNGYDQPVCWAEASQWVASCSHHGSRKAMDWVFFVALKQFFNNYSFPLRFPDN